MTTTMFASMNNEKLLKNPRDSFLIAEGYVHIITHDADDENE